MLNIFPIQFLAPFAYALLRVCVGFMFISLASRRIKSRNPSIRFFANISVYTATLELILGVFFIAGKDKISGITNERFGSFFNMDFSKNLACLTTTGIN